ncbi:MAG: response regulator transcription factor [Propionibacteriaceae bacterium]|nr:response regulator transcription factor [Propionibacteriaceae bacterium]
METNRTVLLVEDNADLNTVNSRILKLRGYEVFTALTLREARKLLTICEPDIILLDVMLPDGDGIAFCREIRDKVTAHIIFLTAKTEHEDLIKGLAEGGDDYITKPFHPEELLARIEAATRRRTIGSLSTRPLVRGTLSLDLATSQAFVSDVKLPLTPKEFALLYLLLRHAGKPLNKSWLYQRVWKQPMMGDSQALWQQMSRLRRKLEAASNGRVTIFSSRSEGYALNVIELR